MEVTLQADSEEVLARSLWDIFPYPSLVLSQLSNHQGFEVYVRNIMGYE